MITQEKFEAMRAAVREDMCRIIAGEEPLSPGLVPAPPIYSDRDLKIRAEWGHRPMRAIAADLGISKQRVHQIGREMNLPLGAFAANLTTKAALRRTARAAERERAWLFAAAVWERYLAGWTMKQIASDLGEPNWVRCRTIAERLRAEALRCGIHVVWHPGGAIITEAAKPDG